MYSFLQSILGTYTPVSYESFMYDASGDPLLIHVIPDGLAGVDWLYVLSGLAFILVCYSVLKLIGGLICKIS